MIIVGLEKDSSINLLFLIVGGRLPHDLKRINKLSRGKYWRIKDENVKDGRRRRGEKIIGDVTALRERTRSQGVLV